MKDTMYLRCKRCNRILKTDEARKIGYGPTCLKKLEQTKIETKVDLFNINLHQKQN